MRHAFLKFAVILFALSLGSVCCFIAGMSGARPWADFEGSPTDFAINYCYVMTLGLAQPFLILHNPATRDEWSIRRLLAALKQTLPRIVGIAALCGVIFLSIQYFRPPTFCEIQWLQIACSLLGPALIFLAVSTDLKRIATTHS